MRRLILNRINHRYRRRHRRLVGHPVSVSSLINFAASSRYSTSLVIGQQFAQCTACSPSIIGEYRRRGVEFIVESINRRAMLEEMSGLTQLKKETEEMMNAMEVDVDEDEDEDM